MYRTDNQTVINAEGMPPLINAITVVDAKPGTFGELL